MHHVVLPLASVCSGIFPNIGPVSIHLVLLEVSFIRASIGPFKDSETIFLAFNVFSSERGTVRPLFSARAMILIVKPITFV